MTSGVRLGTPAVTTRGLKEEDMDKVAEIIAMVIESEENVGKAKEMVAELTEKYPLCLKKYKFNEATSSAKRIGSPLCHACM